MSTTEKQDQNEVANNFATSSKNLLDVEEKLNEMKNKLNARIGNDRDTVTAQLVACQTLIEQIDTLENSTIPKYLKKVTYLIDRCELSNDEEKQIREKAKLINDMCDEVRAIAEAQEKYFNEKSIELDNEMDD